MPYLIETFVSGKMYFFSVDFKNVYFKNELTYSHIFLFNDDLLAVKHQKIQKRVHVLSPDSLFTPWCAPVEGVV